MTELSMVEQATKQRCIGDVLAERVGVEPDGPKWNKVKPWVSLAGTRAMRNRQLKSVNRQRALVSS